MLYVLHCIDGKGEEERVTSLDRPTREGISELVIISEKGSHHNEATMESFKKPQTPAGYDE
jgi:hypothetical protein